MWSNSLLLILAFGRSAKRIPMGRHFAQAFFIIGLFCSHKSGPQGPYQLYDKEDENLQKQKN